MHWIIQSNLLSYAGYKEFTDTLAHQDIPFSIVNIHNKEITHYNLLNKREPFILQGNHYIVIGEQELVGIAKDKGWIPGAFFIDNIDDTEILYHWNTHLLNNDAKLKTIEQVKFFSDNVFIKPLNSTIFKGKIFNLHEFFNWRNHLPSHISYQESILISKEKNILAEFRLFFVEGHYITGSQYKKDKQNSLSPIIPNEVIHFSNKMIEKWCSAPGFSLDIAQTEQGYKIINLHCLNSSDFFYADISKVIIAIQNYILNQTK